MNIKGLLDRLICNHGIYDNIEFFENTLDAFKLAIKLKLPIKFEVRILKDGTLIVFNKENCKELLNIDSEIEEMTYDELAYISKYKVPTLNEVLNLINGSIPLLIELKTKKYKKNNYINKIIELLNNYKGEFYLESTYHKHLKYIRKIKPEYIIGLVINKKREHNYKKYDFIDININLLDDKKIRKIRENIKVLGHVIKNRTEYEIKKESYDNLVCDGVLDILEK